MDFSKFSQSYLFTVVSFKIIAAAAVAAAAIKRFYKV